MEITKNRADKKVDEIRCWLMENSVFKSKPVGAPYSRARDEQDMLIELETNLWHAVRRFKDSHSELQESGR